MRGRVSLSVLRMLRSPPLRSARVQALVVSAAMLLGACGQEARDAGPPVAQIRFADDRWIASVDSPHLESLRRRQLKPQSPKLMAGSDALGDWAWFREGNAFGKGELRPNPTGFDLSTLDAAKGPTPLPRLLGVAQWFDLDTQGSVEVALTSGDLASREHVISSVPVEPEALSGPLPDGVRLSVVPLDLPAEKLSGFLEPGKLRALRETHVIGRPATFDMADGSGFGLLHFVPAPGTRSLLLLVVATGDRSPVPADVGVFHTNPLEALARTRAVSEEGVAELLVGGISRPSLMLTPGSSLSTRSFGVRAGMQLQLFLGAQGRLPDDGLLRLRLDDGEPGGWVEIPLAELDEVWREQRLSLERLGWNGRSPQQLQMEFLGTDLEPTPVLAVGSPRLLLPPGSAVPGRGLGDSKSEVAQDPLSDAADVAARPNLVIVSLDTLRADRLGVAGNTRGLSPRLDALAARGTAFLSAYANAPYTLPSHTTLFSGLLPETHGVETYLDRIPSAAPWLPSALAEAGYDTAAFTAGGYVAPSFGFGRGFDLYCQIDPLGDQYTPGYARHSWPFPDGRAGALDEALDWVRTREGRPAFLFLHSYMAHEYLPPPDLAERFALTGEDEPPLTYTAKERFGGLHVAEHGLAQADERRLVDAYDATVVAVDRMVGELLDTLEEAGLSEDTIVVITSDHGEELLEHGGTGHGLTLYDEVVRVPLIVRVPGRAQDRRVNERVSLVDLAPTLRELLGLPQPVAMNGSSFATVFDGAELSEREIVARVADRPRSERRALIANDWKLIEASADEELLVQPLAERELYALENDAAEAKNRMDTDADRAAALRRRLDTLSRSSLEERAALRAASGEVSGELSAEMESRLRALGYLGDG